MELDLLNKVKTAFFEGRPQGHPLHRKYAESINAKFFFIDYFLRYHDTNRAAPIRYLSMLLTGVFFPARKFDILFSQEGYFQLGLIHFFRIKKPKMVSLMDTHTPYFITNNKYGKLTNAMFKWTYRRFHSIICVGDYQYEMMQQILGNSKVKLLKTFNGVSNSRIKELKNCQIDYDVPKFIFIGDCTNKNRIITKGLDLAILSFLEIKKVHAQATFTVVGAVDRDILSNIINLDINAIKDLVFIGRSQEIHEHLNNCNIYLHPARGEAWGIAVNEAMLAGLATFVSIETGAKTCVKEVCNDWITSLNKDEITSKINEYWSLPKQQKIVFSERGKVLIESKYTEENAIKEFRKTFNIAIA